MYVKSPIFYMGNKYDLLKKIIPKFPSNKEIDTFIDAFGGSGTVSLNVNYNNIIYNELNKNVVNLLKCMKNVPSEEIIDHICNRINQFNLDDDNVGYYNFRDFYNNNENFDSIDSILDLYTLTFYCFCN